MKGKTLIVILQVVCFLTTLTGLEQVHAIVVDENTAALWLFDEEEEDRGDNVVTDSSGNENNGQISGMEPVIGKFGSGLQGNGVDAYVEVPDNDLLDLTEEATVEMWIYLNAYIPGDHFPMGVVKGESYMLGVDSDKKVMIRIWRERNGMESCRIFSGNTDVSLQSWHHIAFTFSSVAEELKVYLDGQEDGTVWCAGTIVPNANPLEIGRRAGDFLDGIVDEVRVSPVVRTEGEIKKAMQGLGAYRAVRPSGKLAGTWGMLRIAN